MIRRNWSMLTATAAISAGIVGSVVVFNFLFVQNDRLFKSTPKKEMMPPMMPSTNCLGSVMTGNNERNDCALRGATELVRLVLMFGENLRQCRFDSCVEQFFTEILWRYVLGVGSCWFSCSGSWIMLVLSHKFLSLKHIP
ncbi:hypothetical protein Leryth_011839 [Lithospermum erythrorhizon]|nr:hypothetical protein Leryth_011839 [Lithospermum erythrorhizon]